MKKIGVVGIYSIVHCIVDMSCAILVAGVLTPSVTEKANLAVIIILYNLFAFAFQFPFGILADKFNKNAVVSAMGCLCIIAAYIINTCSVLAGVMAGVGNALFHIGGGIDVLNIAEERAALPGIYVATGALGLYLGSDVGKIRFVGALTVILILLGSSAVLIWLHKQMKQKYKINNEIPKPKESSDGREAVTLCLLFTICVRGYIGLILDFEWKSNFTIGLICVLAVVFGKMLGGILGDQFGWKKVSIFSLAASAFFFFLAFDNEICGILAILLFNMTMPITLTAQANIFNKNKGMAFGLTTLALFLGAIPVLFGKCGYLFNRAGLFITTLLSALILYLGLTEYEKLEMKND